MNVVLWLAMKDVLLLLRDRTGFIVAFVSPLIYAVFFGIVLSERLGNLDSLRMVAIDEDRSEFSENLIDTLRHGSGIKVEMASRWNGLEAFRKGDSDFLVIIPDGFGSRAIKGTETGLPMIEVALRPGLSDFGQLLRGISPIMGAFRSEMHFNASTSPATVYAIAFPQGVTWGLLGCTAAFGLSLVVERNRGTLPRLLAAPITRTQILAGKAGACFTTSFLLGVVLFAISWFFFDVYPCSIGLLALAMFSVSFAFVGIMMFLSVWGRTEQAASGIIWSALLAMSMLGGGMVPRFLMPTALQQFSEVSPVRWAILAMEGAVWRGFTPGEMVRPCGILLAIGLCCFVFGVARFRWTD